MSVKAFCIYLPIPGRHQKKLDQFLAGCDGPKAHITVIPTFLVESDRILSDVNDTITRFRERTGIYGVRIGGIQPALLKKNVLALNVEVDPTVMDQIIKLKLELDSYVSFNNPLSAAALRERPDLHLTVRNHRRYNHSEKADQAVDNFPGMQFCCEGLTLGGRMLQQIGCTTSYFMHL